jgi:hypothetical protein
VRHFAILLASSSIACSSTSHSDLSAPPDTGVHYGPAPTADASWVPPETLGEPLDVFADVPPFTPVTPKPVGSLASRHVAHTGKTLTGSDCSSKCHDGHDPEAPALAFGGTVYWGPDAKKVAPGVEIRVRDANGKDYVVYSDQGGNFWQLGKSSTFPWPAHTGARNATDAVLMTADFHDQGCNANECHDGIASDDGTIDYPRITVPPPPDDAGLGDDADAGTADADADAP